MVFKLYELKFIQFLFKKYIFNIKYYKLYYDILKKLLLILIKIFKF